MKINVEIEATAREVREFFGLPNVQPLHDEIIDQVRENMKKGVTGFDALTLMKPVFPAQMQTLETLQKAFWDAFARTTGSSVKKAGDQDDPDAPSRD